MSVANGTGAYWAGLPYVWEGGIAKLALRGDTADEVHWNYTDAARRDAVEGRLRRG